MGFDHREPTWPVQEQGFGPRRVPLGEKVAAMTTEVFIPYKPHAATLRVVEQANAKSSAFHDRQRAQRARHQSASKHDVCVCNDRGLTSHPTALNDHA